VAQAAVTSLGKRLSRGRSFPQLARWSVVIGYGYFSGRSALGAAEVQILTWAKAHPVTACSLTLSFAGGDKGEILRHLARAGSATLPEAQDK
jgi:hypothetical protein